MNPVKPNALLFDLTDSHTTPLDRAFRMEELASLVETLGSVSVVGKISRRAKIDLKTFVTSNTITELLVEAKEKEVKTIIFGNVMKPRQIYELSEIFRPAKIEVWDKIDLILKIFSLHAQSSEAKLQIELAKIRHMGPRIFGMGDELSRQGGGARGRGIGETNTEVMKRHLRREELSIVEKLKKAEDTKALQRERRKRDNFLTVALVGYTNAGKSFLMNRLSKKGVNVKDALFETLDTRIGKIYLPMVQKEVLVSDTIGFIADLPPHLISAFRSTLSESVHADILLHIVDVSDPRRTEKIKVVDEILSTLGIAEKPQILIFNKTDKAKKRFGKTVLAKEYKLRTPLFCSAQTGEGLEEIKAGLAKMAEASM
ncbi:MAG: GTPase HflX [Candidatus Peregrinibacteria bacterium]